MEGGVFTAKVSRPYFDAWLRRTGRQLAISGRLTQVATALGKADGCQVGDWQSMLRGLLDGNLVPSLEVLTRIDALLASSPVKRSIPNDQGVLALGI